MPAGETIGEAYVQIRPDTKGFESEATTGVTSSLKKVALAAGGLFAAREIFSFGKESVQAFVDSEASALKLADALKKFPALAGANVASFEKLNTVLAKKTRFDDDATAAAEANLAQFGLTEAQLKTLIPLVQDFAARTGTDLVTASTSVGKAILGQGRALKEVGIDFVDAGSAGANFDQIVGGLRTQVGGFAEQEGKSAAGQAEILRNQFGELKERIGGALVPILQSLAEKLLAVVNFLVNLHGPALTIVQVIGAMAAAIGAVLLVTKAWELATKAMAAVQAVLNIVLTANPIGLIVAGIAALTAGLIYAYKHSQTFRDILSAIWDVLKGIGDAVKWVVDKIGDFVKAVGRIKLPDWLVPGSPSPLETTLWGIGGALKQINRNQPDFGGIGFPTLNAVAAGGGGIAGGAGGGVAVLDRQPISVEIDGQTLARVMREELLDFGRRAGPVLTGKI